jgi:hypothetical protein
MACALFTSAFTVQAQQGKWKGTVKYKLSYEGAVSPQAPTEYEIKVFENKTKFIDMFSSGATVITNATAKSVTFMWDFSQVPVDGVQGKWYMRKKVTDEDFAKSTFTFTGNTKTLAGKTVKEVNVVTKNDDGEEDKETIWVCDEVGPAMDLAFYDGLKAMPFEFTMEFKQAGVVIKFEASELKEGGVKDTDLMLETGYTEQTEDEIEELFKLLMKAYGGGDDDI